MTRILAVCLFLQAAILVVSCANPDASRSTLEKAGFRDIVVGKYAWAACGRDDTWSTHFEATNPLGARVSGVVCCGYWKNCTVRF